MKTKVILINLVMMLFFGNSALSQSIAVSNLNTHGVGVSPSVAAKLTRIELIKLEKYTVLDVFDMESVIEFDNPESECFGKNCLIEMGKKLEVNYMLSGSLDALGKKIVVTIKIIDVQGEKLHMTKSMEFDDQAAEISRMIEIVLREMHQMPINEETKKSLSFKNEVIVSENVGKISNSGPRFGMAYVGIGDMNSFFMRSEEEGGLGIQPVMTNIGYQFEVQYIGTENFSALFEVIPNIGGMEQGQFIPTLSLLNGFRFGKAGWEFAFGPSFGARKTIKGFEDTDGTFYSESEWFDKDYAEWSSDPNNVDQQTGNWINEYTAPSKSIYSKRLDTRGVTEFNTNWLMAVGRTFKSGALNIPVNVYYSGSQYGGVMGASVGFNVVRKKQSINQTF
jgi:TolB-like protein